MRYQDKKALLEDIEKKFEKYCKKYECDDLEDRFRVIREFEYDTFLSRSRHGVIPGLQNFIEFHHPIVFYIRDQERKCNIVEISLTDRGWGFYCPNWETQRIKDLKNDEEKMKKALDYIADVTKEKKFTVIRTEELLNDPEAEGLIIFAGYYFNKKKIYDNLADWIEKIFLPALKKNR